MNQYLFYIEGLNCERWVTSKSESDAHKKLWKNLSDVEQNAVVQMECIESKLLKPFDEIWLSATESIRTFSGKVPEADLKWHWDEQSRTVTPLVENSWLLQLDNRLPIPLVINQEYQIKAGVYHRLIRKDDANDLVLKIVRHE